MAEQYTTRRERREAERRAAQAEYEAQHSDQASEPDAQEIADDDYPQHPAELLEPVTATPQQSMPVVVKPAQPAAARPATTPAVPADPPATVDEAPAEVAEPEEAPAETASPVNIPQFATRAERRRYMRDNGLEPTPVDKDQGEAQAEVEKQVTAEDSEPPVPEPVSHKEPVQEQTPVGEPAQDKQEVAAQAPVIEAVPEVVQPGEPVELEPETPQVDPEPAEPTDWVKRRQAVAKPRERRTPVVKPPQTQGITVISRTVPPAESALVAPTAPPTVGPEQAEASSTSSIGQNNPNRAGAPWNTFRGTASGPATMPIESVTISPEENQLLHADEGDEVENPPVGPRKAREVTYGDGEILVGDRPSALPYIVLGVGGVIAIILIIIALIMLF